MIELKTVGAFTAKDDLQLRSYLKAIGQQDGLLINFGQRRLQFKRLVLEQDELVGSA